MGLDRRRLLVGLGAATLACRTQGKGALAQVPEKKAIPDFPNIATFRTGDLIWPKKKGSIVPRTRSLQAQPSQERRDWEADRQRMLANPEAAGLSPEVAERLKTMSYDEFERLYFSTQETPPQGASRSASAIRQTISVGHVGFIEVPSSGIPYVIEATPHKADGTRGGVIRVRYAEWLKTYSNIQVWHGRFRDIDARTNRRVVEAASRQLGKPYDFFNFDLNDDRGFYCSKLIWMSLWRTAHIAADDNPEPQRGNRFPPWFSPKTLLGAKRVALLHKPAEY